MANGTDPGYSYYSATGSHSYAISRQTNKSSTLVTGNYAITGSHNSGIMISGSVVGTVTLYIGGTIDLKTLTAGVFYPFVISQIAVSAGGVYVIGG